LLAVPASAVTLWREGENPTADKMNRHPWWYDKVKRGELSDGRWLSNFHEQKQGTATYRVQVPETADYAFWLRANPVKSKLSVQLDDGPWRLVDFADARDRRNIAADGKPDLRFIAWVKVDDLRLTKGAHTLRFKTHSAAQNHGAIDCFVLTTEPFVPRGAGKPQGPPPQVWPEDETWAFRPGRDEFAGDALLDLRSMNEHTAGETGFVTASEEGDFLKGDGSKLRLWAAHSTVYRKGPVALAEHAKFLAKRGVNIVRWHGNITPKAEDSKLTDFDAKARDELWHYVAAMKKEGIYMTLSPYYAMPTKPKPGWGLPEGSKDMHALLFFRPDLQAAYKGWLRAIFEPKNPYTGIPLKDEPAVAIIQIQNEDSLLFWTVANLKGRDLAMLQKQYGQWLIEKYGSLEKASKAWQGDSAEGDDFAAGRAGFRHIWEMTGAAGRRFKYGPGRQARLADQLQFWTETMRSFNAEIVRFLREEIGCKQLVNPGNWKTADPVRLMDAERYSYTAGEVIGVNRYYGGGAHIGKHRGWAIVNGDRFNNWSVLRRPAHLPVGLKQVAGHPTIVPENNWVPPLGKQSEGPFLVSAYASLTGVDALYWFNMGQPQWRQPSSANGFLPSLGKWVANTPMIAGMFPAAALLHRRGYVQRGTPVVHERRRLEDLWQRRIPIISEEGSYDPNRDPGDYAPDSNIKQRVSPLAFLVGPVKVTYGADPSKSEVMDLKPYINETKQVVRSVTRELRWDYGRGICTLDAPKAKGATGVLGQVGTVRLDGLTLAVKNDYATVLAVAMDDRPLADSRRVLVQVGTIARPTDWAVREVTWQDKEAGKQEGLEIVNYGRAPWRVRNAEIAVTLANPALRTATLLDPNGYPVREVPVARNGQSLRVQLPPQTMYLILQRSARGSL
jgi:hypothetical protein